MPTRTGQVGPRERQRPRHGPVGAPIGVSANIRTDFGAVDSGANDASHFASFHSWASAQTKPVNLLIPAGTYSIPATRWPDDIKNLTVTATGATVDFVTFGISAQFFDDLHHARVQTVSAGASSVTLVDSSKASLFNAGRWALITGIDLQGDGGPSNNWFFEYVKILSVVGPVVTFTTPLGNSYKSTWPNYSIISFDQGGAATLYALAEAWEGSYTFNGMTVNQTEGGVYGSKQHITLNDCVFSLMNPAPSISDSYILNRCVTSSEDVEADKLFNNLVLRNHHANGNILLQSASHRSVQLIDCALHTIVGTGRNLKITGSTASSLRVGATWGITERLVVADSTISAVSIFPGLRQPISDFTYSAGVFSRAKSHRPILWAVPGSSMLYTDDTGSYNYGNAFTVLDIGDDGTNTLIYTDAPDPLPTFTGVLDPPTNFMPHPCRDVTVTNSVGCGAIVDLSTGNANRPLFEHVLRTLTGDIQQQSLMQCWGSLVSLRVNVTRAYTGSLSNLRVNIGGPFQAVTINPDTLAVYLWAPIVDLKVGGERIITPSGNTGVQSGDTLATVNALWLMQGVVPTLSADISGEASNLWPIYTVELFTNQG